MHRKVGGSHDLSILTADPGDGESQEDPDRTKPPDRRGDVRGECELAETWRHDHGRLLTLMPCDSYEGRNRRATSSRGLVRAPSTYFFTTRRHLAGRDRPGHVE